MRKEILEYINETFPNLEHPIHIRFELGEPYKNGTDERLCQVNERVKSIFNYLFRKGDEVYIYIFDWMEEDPMFGNTTPNYLYEILKDEKINSTVVQKKEDESCTEIIKVKESLIHNNVERIDFSAIFSGIANYEQGREPSIGQEIYIISMDKNLLFKMYDDRGCIVFSNKKENLIDLYKKYNNWIVEYWRATINEIFS